MTNSKTAAGVLIAVVAVIAFGSAFALAKAAGGSSDSEPSGPQEIEQKSASPAVPGLGAPAAVPALRPAPAPAPAPSGGGGSAPSGGGGSAPAPAPAPSGGGGGGGSGGGGGGGAILEG